MKDRAKSGIRTATAADIPAIERLLLASRLPAEGACEHLSSFFVAEAGGNVVGTAGLEPCGDGIGLVRSLCVSPAHRRRRLGHELLERVFARAGELGISRLYLLTTDAPGYFLRHGFAPRDRGEAPEAIRGTQQFRQLCPKSAVLMFRSAAAAGEALRILE